MASHHILDRHVHMHAGIVHNEIYSSV